MNKNNTNGNLKSLKVLSLNTWLLRTPVGIDISHDIDERVKIIPKKISETDADIIFLQEVWSEKILEKVIDGFKKVGYNNFSHISPKNGFNPIKNYFGNGLLIISKYELKSTKECLVFNNSTRFDENFVNKGAIYAQAYIPGVGEIDLFNAHLGAVTYLKKLKSFDPKEVKSRLQQAKQLIEWIRDTKNPGKTSIVAIDLNSHDLKFENGKFSDEKSTEYELFTSSEDFGNLDMIDTFKFSNQNTNEKNILSYDKSNFYVSEGFFKEGPSENLDYIFISKFPEVFVQSSKLIFKEKIKLISEDGKIKEVGVSDHYAILTSLMLPMREKIDFNFNNSLVKDLGKETESKIQ